MGFVNDYDAVVEQVIDLVQALQSQQPVPSKTVVMNELVFITYHFRDLLVQLLSIGGCKIRVIARFFYIHKPRTAPVRYKLGIFTKPEHREQRLFVFDFIASGRIIQP